jgi:uncharacterized protein (TIGR02217 family)
MTTTIIPDTSEIFPACPTYGFNSLPNYLVKITSREGGFERRNRIWSRPLHKYSGTPFGNQFQDDVEAILNFWHAMGGMWSGFRFKDWIDYKSCGLSATPSRLDQPIVNSEESSPATYRLIKQYVAGSMIQQREILRPLGSSILIANEVGALQTDWSLNEATGLLTPGGSFSGTPTHWGGEFYVWCRFDSILNPTIADFKIQSLTVDLAEIRVPLP